MEFFPFNPNCQIESVFEDKQTIFDQFCNKINFGMKLQFSKLPGPNCNFANFEDQFGNFPKLNQNGKLA